MSETTGSATVREMEGAWINSGGRKAAEVPDVVRAMWFLSSVVVNWRRFYSPAIRRATGKAGTSEDVHEALVQLVGIGRTADALLRDIGAA